MQCVECSQSSGCRGAGFTLEGILRNAGRDHRDELCDMCVYAPFPRHSAAEQIDRHAAILAVIRCDERLDAHHVIRIVAKDDDSIIGQVASRETVQQAGKGCGILAHHPIGRIEKDDGGLLLRRLSGGEPSEQIAGDDRGSLLTPSASIFLFSNPTAERSASKNVAWIAPRLRHSSPILPVPAKQS